MVYATVNKTRQKGRIVDVATRLVLGKEEELIARLEGSPCSKNINTSLLERYNGTARHFNARKHRKTYDFSKQRKEHEAMSWIATVSYNFCRPNRSLRLRTGPRSFRPQSPAMVAGVTDHLWTLAEFLARPVRAVEAKQ
jgi:hypothetical protein